MAQKPTISQIPEDGFSLAYARDAGDLRFNVMAFLAVLSAGAFAYAGFQALLVFAVATGCAAYYFFPLKERRARLGANQYGVFIDGFGLVSWRAIGEIKRVTFATRLMETSELQFVLRQPLESALLADWRRLPVWRLLMKLPWSMGYDNIVRINLEMFDPPPDEILRTFQRMWKYYGGGR
jgi:hypothetical protein